MLMCIGDLIKNTDAGSDRLGWGSQFCICNKMAGDACAAGPWVAKLVWSAWSLSLFGNTYNILLSMWTQVTILDQRFIINTFLETA